MIVSCTDRRHIVHRLLHLVRFPDRYVSPSSVISWISSRGALRIENRQHRTALPCDTPALLRPKHWSGVSTIRPTSAGFLTVLRRRWSYRPAFICISIRVRSAISTLALFRDVTASFIHSRGHSLRSVCPSEWICHYEKRAQLDRPSGIQCARIVEC